MNRNVASESLERIYQTAQRTDLPPDVAKASQGPTLKISSLKFLSQIFRDLNPKSVLEFGSGLSTRFMLDKLATRDDFLLVSVDHSADYLNQTRSQVQNQKQLVACHAPLSFYIHGGRAFVTYHSRYLKQIPQGTEFDLVLIDGPLGFFFREAPLYQAARFLKPDTVVLLDDSHRTHEQVALGNWRRFWKDSRIVSFGQNEPISAFVLGNSFSVESAPWSLTEKALSFVRSFRRLVYIWSHRIRGNLYKL